MTQRPTFQTATTAKGWTFVDCQALDANNPVLFRYDPKNEVVRLGGILQLNAVPGYLVAPKYLWPKTTQYGTVTWQDMTDNNTYVAGCYIGVTGYLTLLTGSVSFEVNDRIFLGPMSWIVGE